MTDPWEEIDEWIDSAEIITGIRPKNAIKIDKPPIVTARLKPKNVQLSCCKIAVFNPKFTYRNEVYDDLTVCRSQRNYWVADDMNIVGSYDDIVVLFGEKVYPSVQLTISVGKYGPRFTQRFFIIPRELIGDCDITIVSERVLGIQNGNIYIKDGKWIVPASEDSSDDLLED